jgi:manganese transport protein
MSKVLELFLGILTAMGGFVEVGELTFALNAGSRFGYQLLWVVALGTLGIMVFGEMSGRVAAVKHQAVFGLVRERVGMRAGLLTLIAATAVCVLTCAAEIGAIALIWNLLSGWPYRGLLLLVLAGLVVIVWAVPFKWIERIFGLGGLMMIVFMVLAMRLYPDWSQVAAGFVPRWPEIEPGDGPLFAYMAVALFSSILLPYETYFYASGAIEDHWKPADVSVNRIVVIVGFGLGALLALSLVITGHLAFGPRDIEAVTPGTAALPMGDTLGRLAVWIALLGMLFAFAGAAIETCLSCAYNLAQFFGWPWGKYRAPSAAPRFTLAWALVFAFASAIVLTGVDPVQVVEYSIVFSVVILPLSYFPLLTVAGDRAVMGQYANGRLSRTLGWGFFGLVSLAALAAIPLMLATHGGKG